MGAGASTQDDPLNWSSEQLAQQVQLKLNDDSYGERIVAAGYDGPMMMLLSPSELPILCEYFGVKRSHVDLIASSLDDLRNGAFPSNKKSATASGKGGGPEQQQMQQQQQQLQQWQSGSQREQEHAPQHTDGHDYDECFDLGVSGAMDLLGDHRNDEEELVIGDRLQAHLVMEQQAQQRAQQEATRKMRARRMRRREFTAAAAVAKGQEDCAICLEALTLSNCCQLPCSHYFHRHCIKSLRGHATRSCPMCRATFNKPLSAFVTVSRTPSSSSSSSQSGKDKAQSSSPASFEHIGGLLKAADSTTPHCVLLLLLLLLRAAERRSSGVREGEQQRLDEAARNRHAQRRGRLSPTTTFLRRSWTMARILAVVAGRRWQRREPATPEWRTRQCYGI